MEKRNKQLVLNTMILGLGTICTKGIMFLMTPLFTRWISQGDYGIFDLIITYISLFVPIITLDCGEAVFRLMLEKNNDNRDKKIITSAFLIDIIGFIISLLITMIIWLVVDKHKIIFLYFLILLILEAINNLMTMIMRGLKKLNIYTISNIIFVITMVISTIVFVKILGFQLQGLLLGYIIGYLVSITFMCIKSNVLKYLSMKYIDKNIIKEMLKYSLPLIPNALSWWIVNVSDRTIVTMFLGSVSNAILAVANKIPNLCQTLFNVFHISWQESAIETMDDDDKTLFYTDVMNNMIMILGTICIVILSINFLIFKYLFTSAYHEASYLVPVLILSIIISMLTQFVGGIYIAQKKSTKNGKTTLIAAGVNIVTHLGLIKFIGIYAAVISTFISYLVLFIIRYIDIKKSINLKFYKRTILLFCVFIYFFTMTYIDILYINVFNLILAIIYFIYINKSMISKLLNKILMGG